MNICNSRKIRVSYGGNYEECRLLGQITRSYTKEENILPYFVMHKYHTVIAAPNIRPTKLRALHRLKIIREKKFI